MTGLICSFLDFITGLITKYIPSLGLENGTLASIASGFDTVINFIAQVNFIVPLPTFFIILSLVYGFKLGKFLLFVINWVIRRIRGG